MGLIDAVVAVPNSSAALSHADDEAFLILDRIGIRSSTAICGSCDSYLFTERNFGCAEFGGVFKCGCFLLLSCYNCPSNYFVNLLVILIELKYN